MAAAQPGDAGRNPLRWVVCLLLFSITSINYIDRQVISVLKPTLTHEYGWSQVDYSNIIFAFQLSYAIAYAAAGWMLDRIGVRFGYPLIVCCWSLAAVTHGAVQHLPTHAGLFATLGGVSVVGFIIARVVLGVAEGGNFPAAIKTVALWFPAGERATATGLFNSGSNIGALLTPIIVPLLALRFGWPAAFYCTGALGFGWVIFWLLLYREPEARHVADEPTTNVRWAALLRHRQVWAVAIARMLTEPAWSLILFWIPDFLATRYRLDLKTFGPPLVAIYLISDVGSIGGGWLSSALLRRGFTVNAARKMTMLACAMLVVPVAMASHASQLWVAVLIVGLAAAAHQGWSANLYVIVTDTVPTRAVSSAIGLAGMVGALGAMTMAKANGYVLAWTHNQYAILFGVAAVSYLVALLVLHLMLPRLQPMDLAEEPSS